MDTILTKIAKTNIIKSLRKYNYPKVYNMADIKSITFYSEIIEVETRDGKTHLIPLKIG